MNETQLESVADTWGLVDDARARFFYLARTFRPRIPAGAMAEVPLGLFDDGAVRQVVGARGAYDAPGLLVAGTVDVAWEEVGGTWVVDFKAGEDKYVPPIAMNWQVRGGSLLVAKWLGKRRIIPALCFVEGAKAGQHQSEGRWEVGTALEESELDKIETELLAVTSRISEAKKRGVRDLDMVTGPQCDYCPCRAVCPAHMNEVRSVVTSDIGSAPRFLSAEEASKLAGLLPRMKKVVAMVETSLKMYGSEHGPIPLTDGKVYGPTAETRVRLATRPTYQALYDYFVSFYDQEEPLDDAENRAERIASLAADAADAAFKTSKAAIGAAIAEAHDAKEILRKKSAATRDVLAAVAAKDGISTRDAVIWSNHWPGGSPDEDEVL
ncbi:MAG: PD-(D/E)XK nuclease family protein [Methanomicrobiales archaeon]|nr:PD-(D/E)XK nuclease family protein [Methanomicrobiales archaeon]